MQGTETLGQMLPYLVPFIVLTMALLVFSLIDLARRDHVAGGNKLIWVAVIVLVQTIGPVIYLVFGRKEGHVEGD